MSHIVRPISAAIFAAVCGLGVHRSIVAAEAAKPTTMADVIAASKPSDWHTLDPHNTIYLTLPNGRVIIELAPGFAPKHAANIKVLVSEKYFDGLSFLRSQDNYVVQWGDPDAEDNAKRRSVGSAARTLKAEFTIPQSKDLPFTVLPDRDGYAPQTGFSGDFPAARDPKTGTAWLTHCYGAVGVGRDNDADSGGGAELYVVIASAARWLDRNITIAGRVVQGMELLSTMPRGTAALGFYDKPEQRIPITSIRLESDVPEAERAHVEILRTDTPTFAALVESRRNRKDDWYKVPAGYVDVCSVPIPVRAKEKK